MLHKASILVVDDNRQVLEQVQHILGDAGYQISFIPKGEFLFKRLASGKFDLVLLDLNLPGMNGFELLAELAENPAYKTMPVIVISAEGEDETLARCLALGAKDFIRKPIHHEILKARVGSVVSAARFHENELIQERREALRARMRMLSSQMNPHFIFNALSSIQEFVLANNSERVLEYLSDFAGLMRQNLENSLVPRITLSEELTFLKAYLKLERIRFDGVFEYRVQNDVDAPKTIMIPPMLIQPFLENAIIHGLLKSPRPGRLVLAISEEEQTVKCIIEDNGIGRAKAAEIAPASHRSVAMSNIDARLELLNMESGVDEFSVVVDDLEEEGKAAGTRVTLRFPNDLH